MCHKSSNNMTEKLQEFDANIDGAESSDRFLLCLLSALELDCELVFELNGALQCIISLKLMLCNVMSMLNHVGNPLLSPSFSSGSVLQAN